MRTVELQDKIVLLIDQTKLPGETAWVECRTSEEVGEAIRSLKVRGAPAIGVTAAFGLTLAGEQIESSDVEGWLRQLEAAADCLRATRPTAVNLGWALDQGLAEARAAGPSGVPEARQALRRFAQSLADRDVETNRQMAAFGQAFIPTKARVLTHCNTGALATVDYGTALGVIRYAHESGKEPIVLVGETRPFLQGSRLTAWELDRLGIPYTLITDSMAGHFMARGEVDLVIVGADRVAANGDVANKIGTYTLAVLCREHGIPFYIAAPTSTIDMACPNGAEIPIEQRNPAEVTHLAGVRIAPQDARAANPAFDVTPARFVTAIVTERGIARPPYKDSLSTLVLLDKA